MTQRRTDVDLVRFLALASMFVAHVAPVPGPAHVLELSEYLTMPLFALLVGVGAQLGAWSAETPLQRWWSIAVRATVLVALGLALERAGAQVVVVLVHLGVLLLVAGVLARLPDVVVALVAAAAVIAGELLLRTDATELLLGDTWTADVARFVWVGGPYRLLPMVLYAAIGIVASRRLLRGPRSSSVLLPGAVGGGLLALAATMLAAEQAGRIDLVPYSGTLQETLLDCLVAAGVLAVGLAAARALGTRPPGGAVLTVLAAAGAMTLTLYALQILWLAFDVRVLHPGQTDDSWTNLGILLIGSLTVAGMWHGVVRRRPWHKGPIEGAVSIATRLVR